MPLHLGYSHVSLSVRDLKTSERWYRDVLSFEPLERPSGDSWDEVVMVHRVSGAMLRLRAYQANEGTLFDPTQTGGDHLAFQVATRFELDDWEKHLSDHGVRHAEIVDRSSGAVLRFRDPDGIQLELRWRNTRF